jgi:hypothetical protein
MKYPLIIADPNASVSANGIKLKTSGFCEINLPQAASALEG